MTTALLEPPPGPVDDGTRRELLAAGAALTLLGFAGCGEDDEPSRSAGARAVTVRHAGGSTVFRDVPDRVVILDDAMLGDVLAFGVVPVGTAAGEGDPTVIRQFQDEAGVDEIPLVAPEFAPDLEAIAAVRPDAIFAMAFQVEEPYWEQLGRIAPTIAVETDANPSAGRFDEQAMRVYAEVFRRPEVVDRILAEYRRRVQRIREEFAGVIDGRTISFATSEGEGMLRLDLPGGWGGAILTEVGFTIPQVQVDAAQPEDPYRAVVSNERTQRFLSTDVVLWRDGERDDLAVERGFPREDVDENPLLARVPAARTGDVLTVGNRVWFLRPVRGRMIVLDQLERQILPALR